jgi:hypothetical protein
MASILSMSNCLARQRIRPSGCLGQGRTNLYNKTNADQSREGPARGTAIYFALAHKREMVGTAFLTVEVVSFFSVLGKIKTFVFVFS